MLRFKEKTKDELKFITYLGNFDGDDIYLAKKYLDRGVNAQDPHVEIMENIVKPIWITKKYHRNHQQKKEYEHMDKLDKHFATESEVPRTVARYIKTHKHYDYVTMRDVKNSPYFYGGDITATNWVKDWWIKNGSQTPWRLCALDIEVNIENPKAEYITHISASMNERSFLGILRERFDGHGYNSDEEIIADIKRNYIEYVPNGAKHWESKEREIMLFDDIKTMISAVFARLHYWQPDVLAIWNIDYDIPWIEREYTNAGGNMKQLYCDPNVPYKYATYEYKRGNNKTETILDDGTIKKSTKKWYEIMHVVKTSASFLVLDAATIFHYIRSQEPVIEGGMGLGNVLDNVLDIGKVHDDSPLKGRAWHVETSNKKPAFYSCYGMFDTDSMNLLDEKTEDFKSTAPSQLGSADFHTFASLPRRLHVAFHFSILPEKHVVGTSPTKIEKDSILGIGGGWIVTVPAYRKLLNEYSIIAEDSTTKTTHFGMVYDLDIVSAYPFATVAANVSSLTTKGEIISIQGKSKDDFLKNNINIIINKSNAASYVTEMMNGPGFKDLFELDIKTELAEV